MADDAVYKWKRPSVIPGFGVTFGFSMAYLGLIVLIPLAALVIRSASLGWHEARERCITPDHSAG